MFNFDFGNEIDDVLAALICCIEKNLICYRDDLVCKSRTVREFYSNRIGRTFSAMMQNVGCDECGTLYVDLPGLQHCSEDGLNTYAHHITYCCCMGRSVLRKPTIKIVTPKLLNSMYSIDGCVFPLGCHNIMMFVHDSFDKDKGCNFNREKVILGAF